MVQVAIIISNTMPWEFRTGPVFDPIAPAESVVDLAFSFMFEGGRVNRIYLQNLQDKSLSGFEAMLDRISTQVFSSTLPEGLLLKHQKPDTSTQLQIPLGARF